eukprot:5444386-Ditylum_brightwellii.AAC.1
MKQQCQAEVWDIQHVKGKQKGGNLEREAVLNNVADKLATDARQSLSWKHHNTPPPFYPASKISISISINNKMITRELQQKLQHAFTSRDLRAHMEQTFERTQNKVDLVNWEIHDSSLTKLNFYRHKFAVKFIQDSYVWAKNYNHHHTNMSGVQETHRKLCTLPILPPEQETMGGFGGRACNNIQTI